MANVLKVIAFFMLLHSSVCFAKMNRRALLQKFMDTAVACQAETGATTSDIDDLIRKQPAAGMEGKCLRACILKNFQLLNANGKFVKYAALKHAKEILKEQPENLKIAIEIIVVCADIPVSDNACEAANQYGKCFKEQAIAHGIKHSKCYLNA